MRVELDQPANQWLPGVQGLAGVTSASAEQHVLDVLLATGDSALGVMAHLQAQGARALHFATARTKLEDIFLNLTGRSLRD